MLSTFILHHFTEQLMEGSGYTCSPLDGSSTAANIVDLQHNIQVSDCVNQRSTRLQDKFMRVYFYYCLLLFFFSLVSFYFLQPFYFSITFNFQESQI